MVSKANDRHQLDNWSSPWVSHERKMSLTNRERRGVGTCGLCRGVSHTERRARAVGVQALLVVECIPLINVEVGREIGSKTGRRRGAASRPGCEVVTAGLGVHAEVSEVEAARCQSTVEHQARCGHISSRTPGRHGRGMHCRQWRGEFHDGGVRGV